MKSLRLSISVEAGDGTHLTTMKYAIRSEIER